MGWSDKRMKVVYGHTDSIYVQIPTIDEAQKICKKINTHVQSLFPNSMGLETHPVQLEFEKYYKTLGVGCVKNRNAGFISWKDGYNLPEPEFVVTGFTMKRISQTQLEKDVQKTVIEMWVNEQTEDEIAKYVKNTFNDIMQGKIPIKQITKRTRLREERLKVKHRCGKQYTFGELISLWRVHNRTLGHTPSCEKCGESMPRTMFTTLEGKGISVGSGIAGLLYYNQNNDIPIEDSYIYIKCLPEGKRFLTPFGEEKAISYISVKEESELEGFTPNYSFYAETVIKKAKPIFDAMAWDITQCREDNNQTGLDDWW
jgi:hypothetical protein